MAFDKQPANQRGVAGALAGRNADLILDCRQGGGLVDTDLEAT
ncbi:MAG: hypothetical protein ACOY37_05700 [Pseudomonadota bacterium]